MAKKTQIRIMAKKTVMKNSAMHSKDCGSSKVQIAILQQQILEISEHLKDNPKDIVCKRRHNEIMQKIAKHQKYLANK